MKLDWIELLALAPFAFYVGAFLLWEVLRLRRRK
jgi:hypothetical protein